MNNKKLRLCRPFFLIAGLATLVGVLVFSQADSGITPNDNRDLDGTDGITSAPFGCDATNGYPFIRFAGAGSERESEIFLFHSPHNQPFSEVLPSTQDPTGNWGASINNTQVSLRFRRPEYLKGESVPAVVILRNMGPLPRGWWRNALPDHGYRFTVWHEGKVATWGRPQQKPDLAPHDVSNLAPTLDPYGCYLGPKTQDLTVIDLRRFFDLKRHGKYSVQAQISLPSSGGKGEENIVSGVATFEIVKQLSE